MWKYSVESAANKQNNSFLLANYWRCQYTRCGPQILTLLEIMYETDSLTYTKEDFFL